MADFYFIFFLVFLKGMMMKKLMNCALLASVLLGNVAFADACPNPPILKESIAKHYGEIEIKACKEQQKFWRVKQDNKMGIIDNKGNIVIPFNYDYIGKYSQSSDYLSVAIGDKDRPLLRAKWGIIDKTGKEIIAPQYDYIYPISETLFVVEKQASNELEEMDITLITLEELDNLMALMTLFQSFGVSIVNQDTKIGLVDKHNTPLLPIEYDNIREFDNHFIHIYKDGKALLIDKQGEILKK